MTTATINTESVREAVEKYAKTHSRIPMKDIKEIGPQTQRNWTRLMKAVGIKDVEYFDYRGWDYATGWDGEDHSFNIYAAVKFLVGVLEEEAESLGE